jgi:hypothetical protein
VFYIDEDNHGTGGVQLTILQPAIFISLSKWISIHLPYYTEKM